MFLFRAFKNIAREAIQQELEKKEMRWVTGIIGYTLRGIVRQFWRAANSKAWPFTSN